MTIRRAKRPLNREAVAKANEAFYAKFPEMKGIPLPDKTDDPCMMYKRSVWMDEYIKAGGAYETEQFPDCPPDSTEQKCMNADKPLSEADAKALFNEFAASKVIPFDYPIDCCHTRAHVMCAVMESRGIKCEKYWLEMGEKLLAPTRNGQPITFPDPDEGGKRERVEWGWHVAPTIRVQRADGVVEDMVIDPSISDRPLTKQEWRAIQTTDTNANTLPTSSAVFFPKEFVYDLTEDIYDDNMEQSCERFEAHKKDRNKALEAERKRNNSR